MPNGMTYEEATTIVTNYVTAFFAIIDFGNLKPGQSVLIQSAAGIFLKILIIILRILYSWVDLNAARYYYTLAKLKVSCKDFEKQRFNLIF